MQSLVRTSSNSGCPTTATAHLPPGSSPLGSLPESANHIGMLFAQSPVDRKRQFPAAGIETMEGLVTPPRVPDVVACPSLPEKRSLVFDNDRQGYLELFQGRGVRVRRCVEVVACIPIAPWRPNPKAVPSASGARLQGHVDNRARLPAIFGRAIFRM